MAQQNKAGASGHPGTIPEKNLGKYFKKMSEKCLGKHVAQLSYERLRNWHAVVVTCWKDNPMQNAPFQKGFTVFFYENLC